MDSRWRPGVLIGGTLVLTGGLWTQRHENRRHWHTLLHEAAAELALSYTQESAAANVLRRRGRTRDDHDDGAYVVVRQRAKSKIRTLPDGDRLDTHWVPLDDAIRELWNALEGTDEEFRSARRGVSIAVQEFGSEIRRRVSV